MRINARRYRESPLGMQRINTGAVIIHPSPEDNKLPPDPLQDGCKPCNFNKPAKKHGTVEDFFNWKCARELLKLLKLERRRARKLLKHVSQFYCALKT